MLSKLISIFILIGSAAVCCSGQVTALGFRPVAAEYSTALDRMILVSAGPNLLHIYSPITQADQAVALSAAPLSLAVSPDGMHAAVGHSSLVSYVNLGTGVVEKTVGISFSAANLALSSTWIYVFSGASSSGASTLSINIGTGAVSSKGVIFTGTTTRYNAAVNTIYGTRDGTSPDDIERYDISNGPIANQTDSIYHGDFPICGPIFFSPAGDRIYTGCSTVFRASTDASQDMRYIKTINSAASLRSLAESVPLNRIALIQGSISVFGATPNDSVVFLYSADYLNPIGQFALADFAGGGKTFKAHGKWVFFNAASTFLYAVDEADSTSGLLNDFAIQVIPMAASTCAVSVNSSLNVTVSGDGAMGTANIGGPPTCTYQASTDSGWLQIVSGGYGSGNGTLTYLARANPGPASRTGTITIGNAAVTVTQAAQSPASLTGLPYNVTDASYNRSINRLVLISTMPNELHVYDPVGRTDQMIPLPTAPISLSVSPDGRMAAVGHDGGVSFVDLQQNLVSGVFPITNRVLGAVIDGNGFAYLFTPYGPFSGGIYSINVGTGATTTSSANVYGVGVARLSADGGSIYGLASSYIQKWTIQNGTISSSPTTNFSAGGCNNIWLTDDGARLINACGQVYRTSSVPSQDLQPNGTLAPLGSLTWVDHSAAMQMLAVIPAGGSPVPGPAQTPGAASIQLYQDAFLIFAGTISLPQFSAGNSTYPGYGQFVFWNADQTRLIAVEKADASANLLSAYGVSVLSPATTGQSVFSFQSLGGFSTTTAGSSNSTTVGSVHIQASAQSPTPAGLAIFADRQNGVLVSEATVPAVAPGSSGVIYAEAGNSVNTGIAIANPNTTPASVSFYFTDQTGKKYGTGTTTIVPNGQIAAFLSDPPFNGGTAISGTFTFNSSVPVGAIALRLLINQRGENIWTTLPVLQPFGNYFVPVFPSFADGGGWVTQFVLVNTTSGVSKGTLQFYPSGSLSPVLPAPVSVTINGQTGNKFAYSIPAGTAIKLKTSGAGPSVQVGFAQAVADPGYITPTGVAIFSETGGDGTTISEAGVPANSPSSDMVLYAEGSLDASQIRTGLALANTSSSAINVTLSLTTLNGAALRPSATLTIPGNTQLQRFLDEMPGFQNLPAFQGVLRITTPSNPVAVMGLRSRYNERGEFLMTTTSPITASSFPTYSSISYMFPHFADGGGFTTQFILLSQGQSASGQLQLFDQNGRPIAPGFQGQTP
jgi:hypothetical protein